MSSPPAANQSSRISEVGGDGRDQRREPLSPDRWQQVDRCFAAASELTGAERVRLLEQECGDDSNLYRQVCDLLEAGACMSGFLERPPSEMQFLVLQLDQNTHESQLEQGELVDHFEIIRLLGNGGMGVVYLAHDRLLGRLVALKLLNPQWCDSDLARQRLLDEGRATARLNHPSIITIHAIGEHQGSPYLALEHVEGQTLQERLRQSPLNEHEVLETGLAIADALREAHQHGILHLDLKPANIMLDRNGGVRLLDFGVAESLHSNPRRNERQSTSPRHSSGGTPAYMAPEQWQRGQCSPATDIWALGLLLLEMLTGEHPWSGLDITEIGRQVGQLTDGLQVPTQCLSSSPELADLITACLRRQQSRRPDADTLVRFLSASLADRPPVQIHRAPRTRGTCMQCFGNAHQHGRQPCLPPALPESAPPTIPL